MCDYKYVIAHINLMASLKSFIHTSYDTNKSISYNMYDSLKLRKLQCCNFFKQKKLLNSHKTILQKYVVNLCTNVVYECNTCTKM